MMSVCDRRTLSSVAEVKFEVNLAHAIIFTLLENKSQIREKWVNVPNE